MAKSLSEKGREGSPGKRLSAPEHLIPPPTISGVNFPFSACVLRFTCQRHTSSPADDKRNTELLKKLPLKPSVCDRHGERHRQQQREDTARATAKGAPLATKHRMKEELPFFFYNASNTAIRRKVKGFWFNIYHHLNLEQQRQHLAKWVCTWQSLQQSP